MDELIEENMGLVVSIVDSFKPKNTTERQDLIDAGRIGLWKALKKFHPDKGYSISTYVWRPIRWSIIREIRKVKNNISLNDAPEPQINMRDNIWEYYTKDMTDEEKRLINLKAEGYKIKEIAEKTNQSFSNTRKKLYKIIKRMKEANV